jgi:hypothetical protein
MYSKFKHVNASRVHMRAIHAQLGRALHIFEDLGLFFKEPQRKSKLNYPRDNFVTGPQNQCPFQPCVGCCLFKM